MPRILLVEDNPILQNSFLNVFKHLWRAVVIASSQQEAFDVISSRDTLHALITDTRLPLIPWSAPNTMDSSAWFEIAQVFRQKFPQGKVIAMSLSEWSWWKAGENCDVFVNKADIAEYLYEVFDCAS